MFYRKNIYGWEQVLRVAVSAGVVAFAGMKLNGVVSIAVIASAVGFAITGFVGWCPACAMVGRRLKTKEGYGEFRNSP